MDGDHPDTLTPFGAFEHDLRTDVWTWSDELFRIHGYTPGDEEPTTELVVRHKHPDAADRFHTMFRQVRVDGARFAHYHPVVGADGRERMVLSVGEGEVGDLGDRVGLTRIRGYMVDLTSPVRAGQDAAVRGSAVGRATIEQAKGVLMATYTLDADGAFAFLRRWSMEHNVKVAEVSAAVVAAAEQGGTGNVYDALRDLAHQQ